MGCYFSSRSIVFCSIQRSGSFLLSTDNVMLFWESTVMMAWMFFGDICAISMMILLIAVFLSRQFPPHPSLWSQSISCRGLSVMHPWDIVPCRQGWGSGHETFRCISLWELDLELLNVFKPLKHLCICKYKLPHGNECIDNTDGYFNCRRWFQQGRKHCDSVFCECIGTIS